MQCLAGSQALSLGSRDHPTSHLTCLGVSSPPAQGATRPSLGPRASFPQSARGNASSLAGVGMGFHELGWGQTLCSILGPPMSPLSHPISTVPMCEGCTHPPAGCKCGEQVAPCWSPWCECLCLPCMQLWGQDGGSPGTAGGGLVSGGQSWVRIPRDSWSWRTSGQGSLSSQPCLGFRQAVHVGYDPSPEDGPAGLASHMCEVRAIRINILGQAKSRLIKNRECNER